MELSLMGILGKNFQIFATLLLLIYLLLFRAAQTAYGCSQAGSQTEVAPAGLCSSHSNAGFEKRLWPTPRLTMLDPLEPTERAGDWAASSWVTVGFISTEGDGHALASFLNSPGPYLPGPPPRKIWAVCGVLQKMSLLIGQNQDWTILSAADEFSQNWGDRAVAPSWHH